MMPIRSIVAFVFATALMGVPAGVSAQSDKMSEASKSGIRMMLKVQIPVAGGNAAIENGTMGPIFEALMERIKPEGAFFSQEDGLRTVYFVYVVDDETTFGEIHEPLIQGLGARVFDLPVETWEEVSKAIGHTPK